MATAQMHGIPERISDSELLSILDSTNVNWEYVKFIKEFTNFKDELLSEWLNINVKTFRNYKKTDVQLKENLQEQIVLLISLFKHGLEVFGEMEDFHRWLDTENFFLDREKPIKFLKTITGIRFIDNRLTAIEYGDNV